MSLNKFTSSAEKQEYLNVYMKDFKCETLEVENAPSFKGGPLLEYSADPLTPPTIDSVDMSANDGIAIRSPVVGSLATLQSLNAIKNLGRVVVYFYGPAGGTLTVKHNTTAGTGIPFQLSTLADQAYTISATKRYIKLEAIYSQADNAYYLQELTTAS